MVLGLSGQPAHLDDLPWIPAGALQHFFTELIEVQVAQLKWSAAASNSCSASRSWSGGIFSAFAGFQKSLANAPKLKASREAAKRAMPGAW